MFTKTRAFFNPERFQGWGKKRKYFEGWYFKVVNHSEDRAFAFIPGIAMDEAGKKQAFIQVLDGKKKTSVFHTFDAAVFQPQKGKFELSIGNNFFSETTVGLQLDDLKGQLNFTGNIPWPKPWYSPGIMGPYAFAPFMECYHGIVSMDHRVDGMISYQGEQIDFTNGRGYIEKDWGRSFPSAYFWMQTNHFSTPGISLKCSVAKIPWIRKAFTGFIAGLWLQDKLISFTTYNQSRLLKSFADESIVEIVLQNKKYRLELLAHRDRATILASPILGLMDGRIEESMSASVDMKLLETKSKKIIFEDTGRNAGLEVAGKIAEIMV